MGRVTTEGNVSGGKYATAVVGAAEETTKAREKSIGDKDALYSHDEEHLPTSVPSEDLPQHNYRLDDRGLRNIEYVFLFVMILALVTIVVTLVLVFGLQTGADTIIYLPRNSPVKRDPNSASQQYASDWLGKLANRQNLPAWRQHQLFALAAIYYALDGPNWLHGVGHTWLNESRSECLWFSSLYGRFEGGSYIEHSYQNTSNVVLSVCNDAGKYQTLDLRSVFDGTHVADFPNEIALLTSLKSIFLEGAGGFKEPFQSMLKPTILHLAGSLEALSLQNSMVHGEIPSLIQKLTNLGVLDLSHNKLGQSIPPLIRRLTNLEVLDLSHNKLEQRIPPLIGKLTNLEVLDLSHNHLGQAISSGIGLLTNLKYLKLGNNSFVGQLPSQLGLLTALKTLDVTSNLLTGQIPLEITTLQSEHSLEVFLADGNQFE
ncbi:LRR receptor-like serine threonine-protein kinase [Seminavis robusta]|uniref:LRR receptor-like serine threonine-protein kinase n=1 Tax=Seminavis robusta TaxID=568900 RepID=A0A9N8DUD7_9STRA|nr:LRR receptor-like serine threonine-protein kinase [Seminavis robusta]|eukprot:Sro298_g111010.1 LRR receptor-like serine threonine-protein kinase (430) ;mRNA; r:8140-9429